MPWYSVQYFRILQCFSGIFSSVNNLIRHKNKFCRTDKIISESEIVSREAAGSTGWKTWQTGRPKEIYQTGRLPVIISSRWKPEQLKLDFINIPIFNHGKHECLKRVRGPVSINFFLFSVNLNLDLS